MSTNCDAFTSKTNFKDHKTLSEAITYRILAFHNVGYALFQLLELGVLAIVRHNTAFPLTLSLRDVNGCAECYS